MEVATAGAPSGVVPAPLPASSPVLTSTSKLIPAHPSAAFPPPPLAPGALLLRAADDLLLGDHPALRRSGENLRGTKQDWRGCGG